MRPGPLDETTMNEFLADRVSVMIDRGFGDLQVQSNLVASESSQVTGTMAANLVAKARRDLASGQTERAGFYIDRALRLPYNAMAEAPAAVFEAHMTLFTMVCDAVEDCDEHDTTWLDAAEATVPQCGEHALADLLETLRTVDREYELEHAERKRVRAVATSGPRASGTGDVMRDRAGDDEATQRLVVIELLQAATVYESELQRRC